MELTDPKKKKAAIYAFVSSFEGIELKSMLRGMRHFLLSYLKDLEDIGFDDWFGEFRQDLIIFFYFLDELEDIENKK